MHEDGIFKPENCYVYTYASPNVTTAFDSVDEKYGFIWKIVNAEDIVPTVPLYRGQLAFQKIWTYLHLMSI